jgi:predicted phosphate transport protein (TIGR00153 family)
MLSRLLPKQENFFVLFQQAADQLTKAADALQALVNDPSAIAEYAARISDYERHADEVALHTYALLHKTFITPFDRDDINALTGKLDDILDSINHVAQRFTIYHFVTVPSEIVKLTELIAHVINHLKTAVYQLNSLKNLASITQICLEIDQLENAAEAVLLSGVKKLFEHENDFKQLLKLREVYERLKGVINDCQDTANLIKSIMLEYA